MADSSSTDPDLDAAFGGTPNAAPPSTVFASTDPDVNSVTFQDEQKKQDKAKGPTWEDRALGAGDIAATGLLNIPHAVMGSAHDLYSRIVNGTPDHSAPLEAKLGPSGTALVNEIKNSDIGKGVSKTVTSADQALGNFSPTLQDVVHNAVDVGGDVLNLAPVGAGAAGAARGFSGLADSALSAGANTAGRAGSVALLKSEGIPLSVAQESGSKL